METVQPFIPFYIGAVGVNLLISVFLWCGSRIALHRTLLIVWASMIAELVLIAATRHDSVAIRMTAFATLIVSNGFLSSLLCSVAGFKFPLRKVVLVFLGGYIFMLLLNQFLTNPHWIALPVCFGVGFPQIYCSLHALLRSKQKLTSPTLGLAIVLLIGGLHTVDFAYFHDQPRFVPLGFEFGFFLVFAIGSLAPASILEKITREKSQLELEVRYKAQLANASKMSALGEMAGGVAHEINNPLSVMLLSSGRLLKELNKDPEVRLGHFRIEVERINQMVSRISKIVRGMREASRDANEDPIEPVFIQQVIQNALNLCSEKIKSHGTLLTEHHVTENLKVRCRPVQITQVMLNLLKNSLDSIENSEEKWIRIETRAERDQVTVAVMDSGPGIPEEIREKIFEPFFTTKGIGKGTGLGLSISKGIMESQHGSITLDGESKSTEFRVTLPRAQ